MSRIIRYTPLDGLGTIPCDLDECRDFNVTPCEKDGEYNPQPWEIQHLYYSSAGRWVEETLDETFVDDKDGAHGVWVHVFEEIAPLDAARICWKRFGRTPDVLQMYQDELDRELPPADPTPTPPKGERKPPEAPAVCSVAAAASPPGNRNAATATLPENLAPTLLAAGPLVILGEPGDEPIVNGVIKPRLTFPRFHVIKALLEAGKNGLSKDELADRSGHGDAHRILKRLAGSDLDWRSVIQLAGEPGGRYRLRFR